MSVPDLTAYLNGKTEVCHCGQRVAGLGDDECLTCRDRSNLGAARLLLNAARSGKQPHWYVLSLYGQPPVARKWCIACRTLAPLEPPGVVLPMCPHLPCELAKKYWGPTANPVHELCRLVDELGIKGDLGRVSIPLDDDPNPAEPVKAAEPQYGRDPRGAAFAVSRPLTAEVKQELLERAECEEALNKAASMQSRAVKDFVTIRHDARGVMRNFLFHIGDGYNLIVWDALWKSLKAFASTYPVGGWEAKRWDTHMRSAIKDRIDQLKYLPSAEIAASEGPHAKCLSEIREAVASIFKGEPPLFNLPPLDSDEKVPDLDSE